MQGSFEKRVQEKMEELKLTPSEPVWKNIEKELKPKTRGRFPFWVPFVIVLLAGTGWWLLANKDQEGTNKNNVVSPASTSGKETEQNTTNKTTTLPGNPVTAQTGKTTTAPTSLLRNGNVSHQPITEQIYDEQITGIGERYQVRQPYLLGKNKTEKERHEQDIAPGQNGTEGVKGKESNTAKNEHATVNPTKSNTIPVQRQTADQAIDVVTAAKDSLAIKPEEKKTDFPAKASDSVATKTKVAVVQKGWRKTITLEGGLSRTSTGFFAGGARAADFYASPPSGVSNGVSIGYPQPVKAGASFRVGVGLSKDLGNRWEFSVGLQYAYASTRTRVGEFKSIDTAVLSFSRSVSLDGYYRNSDQHTYTNGYHLLELPISLGFRPLVRLPLTLSIGGSYGRLLHTNALSFDRWTNIYYRDKEAVNKNFLAGFAGLQYTIVKKASWRLDAGPAVQYHFSRMQKGDSTSQRLSFAGLKTTFHF